MSSSNGLPEDNDSNSNDSHPGDKTFINKLLVQMKSQFNRTERKTQSSPVLGSPEIEVSHTDQESPIEEHMSDNTLQEDMETEDTKVSYEGETAEQLTDAEMSEEDNNVDEPKGKPRIVLTFRKPSTGKNKSKVAAESQRTGRDKFRAMAANCKEVILKRSSRRRSKDCNESVLQSAIARKEKSYNESNKPQRLTRQLKPTQKILDNIANAAVKLEKNKNDKSKDTSVSSKMESNIRNVVGDNVNSESEKYQEVDTLRRCRNKHKHAKSVKNDLKRIKLTNNDSKKDYDSDHSGQELKLSDSSSSESSKISETKAAEEQLRRRSQRISSK